MKMAKASEKDIDAAGKAMSALDDISRGYVPYRDADEEGPFDFDEDDPEHLRRFYDAMVATLNASPGWPGRVIGGMCYVILYPVNKIVDPEADCLELHPEHEANAKDAARYRWLRRKIAFTGNGDGTSSMHVLNLPDAQGFPEAGQQEQFIDATLDAARIAGVAAAPAPITDIKARDAIEAKAREIYDGWKHLPGWVPWVEGGNSLKQDEARRAVPVRMRFGKRDDVADQAQRTDGAGACPECNGAGEFESALHNEKCEACAGTGKAGVSRTDAETICHKPPMPPKDRP